jgi:Zn-dependent peptidase ImmA (M78 family)
VATNRGRGTRRGLVDHLQAVLTALDQALPGQRAQLARSPISVIQDWDQVDYRVVPEAQTDAGCAVAGAYYATHEPPIIAVADSTSPGRRAFTALHELGHHLQQSSITLADTVEAQGDAAAQFEDAACDAFAAAILLPDAVVGEHLPTTGITARDVAALKRHSSASRAAVCVRSAQRLHAPGHVALLDDDGIVQFAAAHDLPRIPRDSDQSEIPVVREALRSSTHVAQGQTRFLYRDRIAGAELYAQAADIEGYIVVVAVAHHPAWAQGWRPPLVQDKPEPGSWICPRDACGEEFETFNRSCPKCGVPYCPRCGHCGCEARVQERMCPGCFTVYSELFFDGDRCKNCSS